MDLIQIQRALISVSDKSDLIPFARRLAEHGVTIISTGGTARAIAEAGITVTGIEEVTGFPEMMNGRVKTLHPRVHGGLLALRDNEEHVASMKEYGIEPIDLVCVNLYPFEQTIARESVTDAEAIEQIDIGGPSMIRSASKNHRFITVVTDPAQYDSVVNEMSENDGHTTLALRRRMALAAFTRTAAYDTAIAHYLSRTAMEDFPDSFILRLHRGPELRYGENPHQAGAVYLDPSCKEPAVSRARQLHGKTLSFNNLYDADGALELVKEIDGEKLAAAAVIKHANPCGFAVGNRLLDAFEKAYSGDPLAAFGGIVALNRNVDVQTANAITEGQKFLEVIIAPGYESDALKLLMERWKNVRILETGLLPAPSMRSDIERDIKKIIGGLLVQERDLTEFTVSQWQHVAGPKPSVQVLEQMRLATIVVKHLKSNAICLVNDSKLVGAGAGQMDRLASCRIACEKAGERAKGAVAGSDAFFPFSDGPDILIGSGVTGIVQPGGSKRDDDTITVCNEAGVTLVFTGRRHFRH